MSDHIEPTMQWHASQWVEHKLSEFENAWKQAVASQHVTEPKIADFVGDAHVATGDHDQLLRELVRLDVAYRHDQEPSLQHYVSQFPNDAPVIEDVFADMKLDPVPDQIGRYRILSRLGEGGQAVIYRAVHPTLQNELILKLSKHPVAQNQERRDELSAEGRLLASFQHPHVARVFDLDFHEDRAFLLLEFIRGPHLQQYAEQHCITPREAANIVKKLALALDTAHASGVIHCDLTPRNVVISDDGQLRIIDFGLSRIKDAWTDNVELDHRIGGTPAFMAPEQARGETERIGAASDIFALGGILYFLLTGQQPFGGQTRKESLDRAQTCDVDFDALKNRGIPHGLARICRRAMRALPSERYQTARQMVDQLNRFSRRRTLVSLAACGAVVLLGGAAAFSWRPDSDDRSDQPLKSAPKQASSDQPVEKIEQMKSDAPREIGIRVWRGDSFYPLSDAVPLRSGDRLQIHGELRTGLQATLFWIDSEGTAHIQPNDFLPMGTSDRFVSPNEDKWTPLTGPPGNELLLLCAGEQSAASLDDVRDLLRDYNAWPRLPDDYWLQFNTVQTELKSTRKRGPGQSVPGPNIEIKKRAERLRRVLSKKYDIVLGIAFPHAQPD